MNIILFDNPSVRQDLLPLSFTRPLADFRVGITTIREKWEHVVEGEYSYLTAEYLHHKFPMNIAKGDDNLFIAGNICPSYSEGFAAMIAALKPGDAVIQGSSLVAFRGCLSDFDARHFSVKIEAGEPLTEINNLYDIFGVNGEMIRRDYPLECTDESQPLSATNCLIGPGHDSEGRPMVYIAPGARVEGATLNTTHGPIYVGPDVEIMEGSCLRGPVALCVHAVVNMGTKIYPDTTIGPWCKVGGELNNVVIFGFSNKAHDGFLGNAVIGEWCNLGAGCVASNLKNDYTPIKLWNYSAHRFLKTGLQFCGLIMGDHSKAGINTMFNTATVVGVGVNVHGSGFPRNFIASFSDGGASGFSDVSLPKFFDMASRMMVRRGKELTEVDRKIFEEIYKVAETYK